MAKLFEPNKGTFGLECATQSENSTFHVRPPSFLAKTGMYPRTRVWKCC